MDYHRCHITDKEVEQIMDFHEITGIILTSDSCS